MNEINKFLTEERIRQLPRRAQIAFAQRCAKRVLRLFAACWPEAPEKYVRAVEETAVLLANTSVHATSTLAAARAAAAAAEAARSVETAAYAAVAAYTVSAAAKVVASYADATSSDAQIMAARATVDAARAAASINAIVGQKPFVTYVLRDLERIIRLCRLQFWTDQSIVTQDDFGPMWPDGEPNWDALAAKARAKSKHDEVKSLLDEAKLTIESKHARPKLKEEKASSFKQTQQVEPKTKHDTARLAGEEMLRLSLLLPEQADPEFVAQKVLELCWALNRYHIAAEGNGLIIDDWQTFISADESVEVLS